MLATQRCSGRDENNAEVPLLEAQMCFNSSPSCPPSCPPTTEQRCMGGPSLETASALCTMLPCSEDGLDPETKDEQRGLRKKKKNNKQPNKNQTNKITTGQDGDMIPDPFICLYTSYEGG